MPDTDIERVYYIIFSEHALRRLITRSNISFKNAYDVRKYLDIILKELVLRCLAIWDENPNVKHAEGFAVIKKLFMPISMEVGVSRNKQTAYAFTIKTVMPDSFKGAKKTITSKKQLPTKKNIFDYEYLLISRYIHEQIINGRDI